LAKKAQLLCPAESAQFKKARRILKTELVVCLGEQFFAVERPWGDIPKDIQLGYVTDVAVDAKDNVYLFHRGDPPVIVFSPEGEYLRSWGTGRIVDSHGIFAVGERVLLVDRDAHEVQEYDTFGKLLRVLGTRHRPSFGAPFNAPADVAVAPDGDIYVADGYGNSNVHRFSPEGKLLSSWGKPGNGPGEFTTPHAVRIHPDGRVLVADRENNRLQVFSREGEYIHEWRDLYHPMDLYIDTSGMVYVSDQVPRLSMLSPEGKLLGRCRPSPFNSHGLFGDSAGNFYLAETPPENRLTRLTRMR
jgi:DNA-binding beta-propeller fold protein YncE